MIEMMIITRVFRHMMFRTFWLCPRTDIMLFIMYQLSIIPHPNPFK